MPDALSLSELLQQRAQAQAGRTAFALVQADGTLSSRSYKELDERARAIAAVLQRRYPVGSRVLLLYPAGIEFVASFFGALYAGMIAVPGAALTARSERFLPALRAVAADCTPSALLTDDTGLGVLAELEALAPELARLPRLSTQAVPDGMTGEYHPYRAAPEATSVLLYTSGSTSSPKGVAISQLNIVHQCAFQAEAFGYSEQSVHVGWVSHAHGVGLIGGVCIPVYKGFPSYLIPTDAFIERPARWLETISRVKATHSGGANFAYELCNREISPADRARLDLSSWRHAYNGGEIVRAETLDRFAATFGPHGFRESAFCATYGMTEVTTRISGSQGAEGPRLLSVDAEALEENRAEIARPGSRARRLVGSGPAVLHRRVAIVHPETLVRCAPGDVGEIWVAGPDIAQGYWNRPDETARTFGARVSGSDEGPFLRTGDLGFIHDGEIFVTGRLRDLIVIRGRNHDPDDIERTAESAHASLTLGGCVAFSVQVDDEERPVLVAELPSGVGADEVASAIRRAVVTVHELSLHDVVCLPKGAIPRTAGGKVQRGVCRRQYEAGAFPRTGPVPGRHPWRPSEERDDVAQWLARTIAVRLGIDPGEITETKAFADLGVDSAMAVRLAADLGAHTGRNVSPTLLFKYPTVGMLAEHLRGSTAEDEQSLAPRAAVARPPIAVVGYSCRFPGGANDPASFWRLLCEGKDCVREIPGDRWDVDEFYDPSPDAGDKSYSRWGGFIEGIGIDEFDADFFGISAREATEIDPQHRLLLEVTWEAFERAGIPPHKLAGSRTGVFVGISTNDYSAVRRDLGDVMNAYSGAGLAHAAAAGRISYLFGFMGPNIAVNTACSSALVALHLACQSLRNGESNVAVAGGVNALLTPDGAISLSRARMLSPTGGCKAFDASADGFVRGEGCGMLVLKRLSDALAHGDLIAGVLRGTAVNQDGRSNGLTAPNERAQESLIRDALADAGATGADVSYAEAHGTGTPLGDPIEIGALDAVLGERPADSRFVLGAVKTNIGHLEAAAGAAGVIKILLAMEHRSIPRNLHLHELNPRIDWSRIPAVIPTEQTPWELEERLPARIACVSSFGFSGTNAHAILEEPPARPVHESPEERAASAERSHAVLTLSAKTKPALAELARRFAAHLDETTASLHDICFSANTGRSALDHRLAVVCSSAGSLGQALAAVASGEAAEGAIAGEPLPVRRVAFLFTGQGSLYRGMGQRLYRGNPVFRAVLDRCAQRLDRRLDRPLLSLLFSDDGDALTQTGLAQPALYSLQVALVELWRSWGVTPDLVLGHSVGEYAAAYAAGVFELEEGLDLVAERGRLMQSLPPGGAMVSFVASEETLREAIDRAGLRLSVAAVNGPHSVVIAGAEDALETLRAGLPGVKSKRLAVSHAFHSDRMDPILERFRQVAERASFSSPRKEMILAMTGASTDGPVTADYWVRQLREPVRFAAAMRALEARGANVLVEIGPSADLLGMGRDCVEAGNLVWAPSLRKDRDDWHQALESAGRLYCAGVDVDFRGVEAGCRRQKIALPTYPFQRRRYWHEPAAGSGAMVEATQRAAYQRAVRAGLAKADAPALELGLGLAEQASREDLARWYIWKALAELSHGMGASTSVRELIEQQRVLPRYDQLLRRWVSELAAHGAARREGDRFVLQPMAEVQAGALTGVALLSKCGAVLAPVLAGRTDPREVMFPGGSSELVGEVYSKSSKTRYFNEIMSEVARAFASPSPEGQLDVLEVGAGTGSATAEVLPALGSKVGRYTFTDISPTLLKQAKETLGHHDVLDFRPLDLEKHPAKQGFEAGSFQLIVASNVLHATRRLADSLEHMRWLLAPGGMVLIFELVTPTAGFDATFGLLIEQHQDVELRGDNPFLTAEGWRSALRARGLERVSFVPGADDGLASRLGAHVIVARLPHATGASAAPSRGRKQGSAPVGPLVGARLPSPLTLFQSSIGPRSRPWVLDHRVYDAPVLPGAAFVEMALSALSELVHEESGGIDDTLIIEPLAYGAEEGDASVQTVVHPDLTFEIFSQRDGAKGDAWRRHVTGKLIRGDAAAPRVDLDAIRQRCPEEVVTAGLYEEFRARGIDYGPTFQGMRRVWRGKDEAVGQLELDLGSDHRESFRIHPALLDSAFQVLGVARGKGSGRNAFVPIAIDRVRIHAAPPARPWCHVRMVTASADELCSDVRVLDESGAVVVEVSGLRARRAPRQSFAAGAGRAAAWAHEVTWAAQPLNEATQGEQSSGAWVIVSDERGPAEALAKALSRAGEPEVVLVGRGTFTKVDGTHDAIDPSRREDYDRLLADVLAAGRCRGIVYMGSPEVCDDPSAESVPQETSRSCLGLLYLVQSVLNQTGDLPRLWVVTRGAVSTSASQKRLALTQAPLWGFGRVLAAEHPELACRRIDLDPDAEHLDIVDIEALAREILAGDREDQVALRGSERLVARLAPVPNQRFSSVEPRRLEQQTPGLLDSLQMVPVTRRRPGPGEVEVQIIAAGINFYDLVVALDLVRNMIPGGEYAGVVLDVGPDVHEFKVGDAVFGLSGGCFASVMVISTDEVVKMPVNLTFEEAATIPCVFLTVHYALERLAKMRRGQRVLIHAGTGGVGLAAIQLVQRAGAEVFATAGSDEKRALLRSLGVQHVFDSRSLSFVDAILSATGGRGVDVVLNSLNGDFIPASFSVLARNGVFVEIGKRDIWTKEQVAALGKGHEYHVLAVDAIRRRDPRSLKSALTDIAVEFAESRLRPLPIKMFEADDAIEAFRFMQRAQHIGKLCLRMQRRWVIRGDATYLITGGLRGVGLAVAQRLVERGARHLVLVARSEPSAEAEEAVRAMRGAGADVRVHRADVSVEADVVRVLRAIREEMPKLTGVLHAAGTLSDRLMVRQDEASFAHVFGPKVDGTWLLHKHTLSEPLELFVLFSSQAALLGSSGQVNHASACTFQDGFAHYRRRLGLPATSINWGTWSEVGIAAREEILNRLRAAGAVPFSTELGLAWLEAVMAEDMTQVAVGALDWPTFIARDKREKWPFFSRVHRGGVAQSRATKVASDVLDQIRGLSPEARRKELVGFVLRAAGAVLDSASVERIDVDRPLAEQGFDSLMNVELRSLLKSGLGSAVSLPATLTFRYPTVAAIVDFLQGELDGSSRGGETCFEEVRPGRGRPIVFVHAVDGGTESYLKLVEHLKTDRPLVAFKAKGLLPGQDPHETVPQMAEEYVNVLRERGLGGCSIVAWSFGGLIALEMAQRLRAVGQPVEQLVVIDSIMPAQVNVPFSAWYKANMFVAVHTRTMTVDRFALPPPPDLEEREYVRYLVKAVGRDYDESVARAFRIHEVNSDAYSKYQPMPYAGEVVLLRAEKVHLG